MDILLLSIAAAIVIWFFIGMGIDIHYRMLEGGPFWKVWLAAFVIGGPFMGVIAFPLRSLIDKVLDVCSLEKLRNWVRK